MPRWSISPSWSSANASHGLSTGTGPVDAPPLALRWSIVMQRKSFLERLHRVEDRGRPIADPRIQSAAGGNQEREAAARLLVANADIAFLIEWHGNSSSAECGVPRSIVAHRAVPRQTGGAAEGCLMWQFSPILAGAQPSCVRPARQFDAGAQGETKTPTSPAPCERRHGP